MKGAGEEYGKLLQVVQSYALDNPGVSMSCKKSLDGGSELHTLREHTSSDAVRLVHGAAVAHELLPLDGHNAELGLSINGLASNANYT